MQTGAGRGGWLEAGVGSIWKAGVQDQVQHVPACDIGWTCKRYRHVADPL